MPADERRPDLGCILQFCCETWLSFCREVEFWLFCKVGVKGTARFSFLLLTDDLSLCLP